MTDSEIVEKAALDTTHMRELLLYELELLRAVTGDAPGDMQMELLERMCTDLEKMNKEVEI
jgi:hypothetical protein